MGHQRFDILEEVRAILGCETFSEAARADADALLQRESSRDPMLRTLREVIRAPAIDSSPLFAHSTAADADMAAGFLKTREFPAAGFETFAFHDLPIDPKFQVGVPPNAARPVKLLRHTPGLDPARFVALFPEVFVGKTPAPEDQAFYFINKFVRRTQTATLPMIRAFWDPAPFERLLSASEPALDRVMIAWVVMHEGYHQTGALPTPEGLAVKNTRSAAAFEELRVDMLILLHAARRMDADPEFRLLFELVLAERLLRYGAEYDPATTFDPRTSLALWAGLEQAGALTVDGGRWGLDVTHAAQWIEAQCAEIARFERRIAGYDDRDIRVLLRTFIENVAGVEGQWRRNAYFERAAAFLEAK